MVDGWLWDVAKMEMYANLNCCETDGESEFAGGEMVWKVKWEF
jgi:hypothetical protein